MLSGEKLIASTHDATAKAQCEWELGMSLYDALQVAQMRSQLDEALKYGEAAAAHLEKGGDKAAAPTNAFLMGRLYFRLAHPCRPRSRPPAAVAWFDKANPRLDRPLSEAATADVGRYGEILVSMGVSYWEVGQREKAMSLTQKGIAMMERAVQTSSLDSASLAVPYRNLATMHRQLGADRRGRSLPGNGQPR